MEHEEHEELADALDRGADELARENAKLEQEIDKVRQDWEAKRSDAGVPGAVPRDPGEPAAGDTPGPTGEPDATDAA